MLLQFICSGVGGVMEVLWGCDVCKYLRVYVVAECKEVVNAYISHILFHV